MMKEVITGVKFVDARDGRTGRIGERNTKCKTAIVFYDDPKENEINGKSMGYATIKKHFSEVVEEAVPVEKEVKQVVKKEKKERAKKENAARTKFYEEFMKLAKENNTSTIQFIVKTKFI